MGPELMSSGGGPWVVLLAVGLILLAAGLILAYRAGSPRSSRRSAQARDILRQRYATGEITEEEFRARMRVLDDD